MTQEEIRKLEQELWEAADVLRGNSNSRMEEIYAELAQLNEEANALMKQIQLVKL